MTNKELIKGLQELKKLEVGGRPQAGWVLSSRQILMSQLNPKATVSDEAKNQSFYYWRYFSGTFRQRVFQPVGAFLLIIFALLTYNATVSVASASLPGDMLYPIKTAGEKVQLALTFNDESKVKLQMNFVSRRADEMQLIAIQENDNNRKSKKIVQTAKKITQDNKSLKDSLGKISMAANKPAVLEVAKEVDIKSLEIKQNIATVQNSLPEAVKSEVKDEVKEAIVTTEAVGTSALGVIVDNYKTGRANISGQEVASRVAERIKSTEDDIKSASNEVNDVISVVSGTAPSVISTSTSAIKLVDVAGSSTTSTLQNIVQKPQQAKEIIEEAKNLLGQKDFSSALEKIQQSKDIVVNVVSNAQNIVNEIKEVQSINTSTENLLLINSNKTGSQPTTTSLTTGESTKEILIKR
ncbi:MAG: DUF5667 domain-containing protein [Patescibacteria group bacterium]